MSTPIAGDIRIALAQVAYTDGDKAANLTIAAAAVREAALAGADLVVLPEAIVTGFPPLETLRRIAEPRDGPSVEALRQVAVVNSVGLVAGYAELDELTGAIHNTSIVLGRMGEVLTRYHKTHLFHLERLSVTPGEAIDGLFTFNGIRFGLLCCYDIEFPETARKLALAGVQCIVVPTGNMMPWDHHHRVFIQARALENHLFVAYCNRIGLTEWYEFPGDSAIVDPWGQLVCDAGRSACVTWGDLNLRLIEQSRVVFDYLRERRADLYLTADAEDVGERLPARPQKRQWRWQRRSDHVEAERPPAH